MKKSLLLIVLLFLVGCSKASLRVEDKRKYKLSIEWNENIRDVKLGEKKLWKGRDYKVEEGFYKISWKYKELNTVNYQNSFYNYHWFYKEIYLDKDSKLTINGIEIKEGT